MKAFVAGLSVLVVQCCLICASASAQGLICKLPEDGTWIKFEGTYTQKEIRPESTDLEIAPWVEHVWIKSVGTSQAEFRGATTDCRWIEVKIERGREREGKIDTGLTGIEIYKVLVPEASVPSENIDSAGVPVSFLPIVRGYRKIGKADAKELTEPTLQLYPLGILIGYFREMKQVADGVDPEVGLDSVKSAVQLEGQVVSERPNSRTTMESTIWKSAEAPFGIARWSAKIIREGKDAQEPRDAFKPQTEVSIEMRAQQSGTGGPNAASEIPQQ